MEGGLPDPGEEVVVAPLGRRATVMHAGFATHVFAGDVSVRYQDDGGMDLVPLERIERVERMPEEPGRGEKGAG